MLLIIFTVILLQLSQLSLYPPPPIPPGLSSSFLNISALLEIKGKVNTFGLYKHF